MTKFKQRVTTFLWFDNQAEEAGLFYTSLFENSRIVSINRYTEEDADREGSVMLVTFELAGQQFYALNGGSQYRFNESISLLVECEDQEEIDRLWGTLTKDGEEGPCGWLKDKFGVSWQITPSRLLALISDEDRDVAATAMRAMYKMKKVVIADLELAVKHHRR